MIKNKAPYPIEIIALAIAFSPRMEALLCEAKRCTELFKAKLLLLHIGPADPSNDKVLHELLEKYSFDDLDYQLIWEDGEPTNTLLELCKQNVVDLLIFGALQKESLVKSYLGSISREICRKAKCSVLTFTNPTLEPVQFKRIVIDGVEHPKTPFTIATAFYLSDHEVAEKITIVREIHNPALAMTLADDNTEPETQQIKHEMIDEELTNLKELVHSVNDSGKDVTLRCLTGKPGYTIGHYAAKTNADLLVLNSPDKNLTIFDRIFRHDHEFIFRDLPCNVLIVHSRNLE